MADQSVPRTIVDIASEIEIETGKFKACIKLINQALQFGYTDAEQVARAQGQLFLLAEFLGDSQGRFAALTADTYALATAEKAAA